MMPLTRWHKIGICSGIIAFVAGNVLLYGRDVLPQQAFEVLKLPAVVVFVAGIAVGIYCWVRIMKVFADKLVGR
jgi:hypothetical protein